jgi:hypothetical protein
LEHNRVGTHFDIELVDLIGLQRFPPRVQMNGLSGN